MRLTLVSVAVFGLAAPTLAAPKHITQATGGPDPAKAQAIKDAYRVSWKAYYDHAFPNDTLHPVTNSYENDR